MVKLKDGRTATTHAEIVALLAAVEAEGDKPLTVQSLRNQLYGMQLHAAGKARRALASPAPKDVPHL